jgi:hypothetical protein
MELSQPLHHFSGTDGAKQVAVTILTADCPFGIHPSTLDSGIKGARAT